jgi:phosphoglycolate phosphatase-like HAD superfamily hydrolase
MAGVPRHQCGIPSAAPSEWLRFNFPSDLNDKHVFRDRREFVRLRRFTAKEPARFEAILRCRSRFQVPERLSHSLPRGRTAAARGSIDHWDNRHSNSTLRQLPSNPHMIQCIIFDVDGTLVDSVDLHARAWQETLSEFGKQIPFEQMRSQIGKGGDQILPVFLSPKEIEEHGAAISERRTALFKERYLPQVRAFPKVRELFQRILSDGKRIALASSAIGEELQVYKERAQIADLIDMETSKDDAAKSKPYPDIFKAALERLGAPSAAETIVIGDTPYDIEAARKAGLRTIAVRCGGFPEETLRDAIAIFNSPADLMIRYADSPLGQS